MRWLSLVLAVFIGCTSLFVKKERRGWLGVYYRKLTPELAEAYELKEMKGVLVQEVVKGSPAEKAGIQEEDIIFEWDGKEVSYSNFPELVSQSSIGKEVQVKFQRKGKVESASVKVKGKVVDKQFLAQQEYYRQKRREVEANQEAGEEHVKIFENKWFRYGRRGTLTEVSKEEFDWAWWRIEKEYPNTCVIVEVSDDSGGVIYRAIARKEDEVQARDSLEQRYALGGEWITKKEFEARKIDKAFTFEEVVTRQLELEIKDRELIKKRCRDRWFKYDADEGELVEITEEEWENLLARDDMEGYYVEKSFTIRGTYIFNAIYDVTVTFKVVTLGKYTPMARYLLDERIKEPCER